MLQLRHLRLGARYARHRLRELHPFEVQAVLLNACNLKCAYCFCPEMKTALMTTEQWRAVVRRFGELGTLRLKWQGGEPTLRKDFRELCAEVQRAGILCAVITNGTQIPEQPELLDHLDEVVFSLDAVTPELNDAVRGPGVHAQVLRAIEVAAKRDVKMFINMVVGRNNLHEVEPMLSFCERWGIGLNAQPMAFGLEVYDDRARGIALDKEETRDLYRTLAALKRQGRSLMFAANTYEISARWPDYETLTEPSAAESRCAMGRFYVHIDPNGDIKPCVQHGGPFTPKNLVRDGLDESLRHAQHHNCGNCFSAYLNERKAIFGLRPHAMLEFLRRS